jgi:hypothetical protein
MKINLPFLYTCMVTLPRKRAPEIGYFGDRVEIEIDGFTAQEAPVVVRWNDRAEEDFGELRVVGDALYRAKTEFMEDGTTAIVHVSDLSGLDFYDYGKDLNVKPLTEKFRTGDLTHHPNDYREPHGNTRDGVAVAIIANSGDVIAVGHSVWEKCPTPIIQLAAYNDEKGDRLEVAVLAGPGDVEKLRGFRGGHHFSLEFGIDQIDLYRSFVENFRAGIQKDFNAGVEVRAPEIDTFDMPAVVGERRFERSVLALVARYLDGWGKGLQDEHPDFIQAWLDLKRVEIAALAALQAGEFEDPIFDDILSGWDHLCKQKGRDPNDLHRLVTATWDQRPMSVHAIGLKM